LRDAFFDAKKRGIKIRYLTEITKDNLRYCKELMPLVGELRHLNGIKGSFYISEQEYAAPATYHEKGKSADMMIHSTVREIVEHQQYVFDTIWNTSTSAERKIKEIESEGGVSFGITEIIDHPLKTQELFINLIKSAKFEVLLVLPTVNAFMREYRIGAIQILEELSTSAMQRGTPSKENLQEQGGRRAEMSIRILTPTNDDIDKIINNLNLTTTSSRLSEGGEGKLSNKANNSILQIRYLESLPKYNVTTATILVVDRKASLVIEKVDDSKETFVEAVGLSTYSTSAPTIMSYVSIFENFWNQIELYEDLKESKEKLEETNEQLKVHDKMQREFINVAAHELRTPIQAILGYAEILEGESRSRQYVIPIMRNVVRLQGLANNILNVSRIESQTLKLNKEKFNINEKIRTVVEDIKSRGDEIEIAFADPRVDPIVVEADKIRIYEVISNLLTNATKFTRKSDSDSSDGINTITIFTDIKSIQADNKSSSNSAVEEEVIISVRDRGTGIDPNVQDKLFSKFVTTSETGSGLGLFISKGIVEAHGGRMWAQNNPDGIGATFAFSLPLK
jgi:two-component system, OmpR family, sensor histidine kinase VicK